jgi:hypothetical protein
MDVAIDSGYDFIDVSSILPTFQELVLHSRASAISTNSSCTREEPVPMVKIKQESEMGLKQELKVQVQGEGIIASTSLKEGVNRKTSTAELATYDENTTNSPQSVVDGTSSIEEDYPNKSYDDNFARNSNSGEIAGGNGTDKLVRNSLSNLHLTNSSKSTNSESSSSLSVSCNKSSSQDIELKSSSINGKRRREDRVSGALPGLRRSTSSSLVRRPFGRVKF